MRRARHSGASTLLILLIMVLVLVGFFAAYTLSRVATGGDDRADTQRRLAAAAVALERFAAASARLPCPADPAGNAGTEVQATAATCSFGEGTLPWLTLGLTSDAGLDSWGRKISYRVYTGNRGSFTQPGGVSMVECDTVEPTIGSATNAVNSAGGLCVSNADPYQRSTTPAKFLSGKGLSLSDFGVAHDDVAYVLVSHGASGLGAWTIAGAQLAAPASPAERNNMRETGPFTIEAFSGADIEAVHAQHFDDVLAFATIGDLVKRAGLEARDWPDTATSSVTFDSPTVAAAVGRAVSAGDDLGTATLDFGSARVSGFSGATATNISYDTNASGPATGGLGIVGGFDTRMSSLSAEYVHVDFAQAAAKFAVTLNDFGTYSIFGTTFTEQVELRFYLNNTLVGTAITKAACNADGGLASFAVTPAGIFDSVDIVPVNATAGGFSWDTSFLVSEIKACTASTANCKTSLATGANTCP